MPWAPSPAGTGPPRWSQSDPRGLSVRHGPVLRFEDIPFPTSESDAVSLIRILLVDMPRMLRETVVAAVEDEGDLAVVGETTGKEQLLLRAAGADVVVMELNPDRKPAVVELLLDGYPRIGVVGLAPDAVRGVVYQLHPHAQHLDSVTSESLVAAIRRAASGQSGSAWR